MLKTFKLLLPALIPAWNFFDWIAPSPRIEYALQDQADDAPLEWREFRPRPNVISLRATAAHLAFNPRWNESLFLVSCAEGLIEALDDTIAHEIFDRIHADLIRSAQPIPPKAYLRFRIVLLSRRNETIVKDVVFVSSPRALSPKGAA